MTTPRDAAQVLAKCACYDPTFSRPDPAIAQAWAEAFDRYQLELPDLLAAVTRHYVESTDRAMPAHLIGAHADDAVRSVHIEQIECLDDGDNGLLGPA